MSWFRDIFLSPRKAEADRLFDAAGDLYRRSSFREALSIYDRAFAIYRELRERESEARVLGNMANIHRILGDFAQAMQYQEQRLSIARELGHRPIEGRALGDIGALHEAQGNLAQALQHYRQHLAIAEETRSPVDQANALGNIGNAHFLMGDFDDALECQMRSLAITEKGTEGESLVLSAIGNIYLAKSEFSKSVEYQRRSLEAGVRLGNLQLQGYASGNLGMALMLGGDYGSAIAAFEQSLSHVRAIGDRRGEGQALHHLGNIYHYLADRTKCIDYLEQALSIFRRLGDRMSLSQCQANLGTIYLAVGQREKALAALQESLEIKREVDDRRGETAVLLSLSGLFLDARNFDQALAYQAECAVLAKSISYVYAEAHALGMLGIVYQSQGLLAQAIACFEQAIPTARETGDRQLESALLGRLADAFFRLGRLAEAEARLWQAVEILESLRSSLGETLHNKITLFDAQQATYHLLQKVLVSQGKTDKALEVAERARARAFVELLARRGARPEMLEQATAYPTIQRILAIAASQDATLVEYSVVYTGHAVFGTRSLDLYIWVVRPDGAIRLRTSDWSHLLPDLSTSESVLSYGIYEDPSARGRNAILAEPAPESSPESLKEAYSLLIEPIADLLPQSEYERVVFVPHFFTDVPFPALIDGDGLYLVERHTILTAPSIQVLGMTHDRRRALLQVQSAAFVVGNPSMPQVPYAGDGAVRRLPPLPHAEREALEIAKLLDARALIGADATKSAVVARMQSARIVHFATHGLLDDFGGLGIPGAVALAPSDTDDGILTASEIAGLSLQAELVVLSACSTAQGRATADGVVGLSRAFIAAGAAAVVVSLWSVPDAPTASLMIDFYSHLRRSPDKAQALRQAMLAALSRYRETPRNWAAFTLIGEAL